VALAEHLGLPYPFTRAQFEGRGASEVFFVRPYVKKYPKDDGHIVRAGIAVLASGARQIAKILRRR